MAIWWGIIGGVSGFAIGLIIKLIATKKYAKNRATAEKMTEVVLIIECKEHELEMVSNLLWDNHALGISKLDFANKSYIIVGQE